MALVSRAPEAGDGEVDGRTFFVYDGDTADEEYLVGALEILPAAGEAAEVFEIIFVCSLEGRTLVATPQPAWHRTIVEMSNLLSSNPARRLKEARLPVAAPGCFRRERCGANLRPRPGGRRIWISGSARRAAERPDGRGTDQADDSGGEQGVQGFALGTGAGWGHHGRRRRGRKRGERSPSAPASSSRKPRGDLPRDRAPDAGGPNVDDFGAGASPDLLCQPGRGWRTGAG